MHPSTRVSYVTILSLLSSSFQDMHVVFDESSFPYQSMINSHTSPYFSFFTTSVSIPFLLPQHHSHINQVTSQQHLPPPVLQVQQANIQQHNAPSTPISNAYSADLPISGHIETDSTSATSSNTGQ